MRVVKFSTELAIVAFLVGMAVLLSIVIIIRQNPWLVPAVIGGIILWKKRKAVKTEAVVLYERHKARNL